MTAGTQVTPNSSFPMVSGKSILVGRRTSSTTPVLGERSSLGPAASVGRRFLPPESASFLVASRSQD
jgi:hypothetical protein